MKLKLKLIDQVAWILSGIKINRMEDKEAKAALMKDYLALRKACKMAQEDKEEIVKKFQEDWKDEFDAVNKCRRANKPVVGHADYLDAENDAEKAISDILSREVELDIVPVPFDAFSGASDEITLEQIAVLQESGIMKEQ